MSRTIKAAVFLIPGLLFFGIFQGSSASVPLKRILILFPYESNVPGFIDFETSFRSTLTRSTDNQVEFHIECMDLTRFPDERYHDKLMELYREKYSGIKIDLIVAIQPPSLDLLAKHGPESFRNVPVILYSQDSRLLGDPTQMRVAAVVTGRLDMGGTLALAMRLHPDVRKVFVVSGASKFDQRLESLARQELHGFENQVDLQYLSGLPMDELIHRASSLPEHSLIFYLVVFRDGSGKTFKSPEALALISRQANAPIYSVSETYIASGMVGGRLISHSAQGARVAKVALGILDGERPDNMESPAESVNQYVFDARQLKRWGISEENLPPGSDVRYRDISIWEPYFWQMAGVVAVLTFQTFLISALINSIRRRYRAGEAIKASEEFNRAVLASLKNHFAILDKNGTILAVNEAWEQFARQNGAASLAGLGPGVNYLEVCRRSMQGPADAASKALNGILSVLDGKRDTFSFEYPCDSPSEAWWFLMKAMPFRSPGGGVVISHTNITERKKAELEAQMHREERAHVTRIVTIGELATSLAHEINQPLTAILCNAEAAQRFLSGAAPDLDEVRTILDDIIQDDRRAGEVIRRMRTLVKKETPRREMVVVNDAVWETIALVRSASFFGGISITAELDSELPTVQGDRVQLQQVVLNLLLNATAAMSDTPPALRKLVVRTALQDSRNVMVSVRDSGTGIDQHHMDRLFEPFFTTKTDGLGMGLSISRTLIKAHGGRIWAENNPEGGTTFYFTLPLDHGEQS